MSDLLDLARRAATVAKRLGASDASVSATRSRDVEIGWRDGRVEKVSEATTRGLSLALYVDGRFSQVSTSDLRPDAVERFVGDALAMARALAKDPHRGLAEPKLYEGRAKVDLDLRDPGYGAVTADVRKNLAKLLEDGARGAPGADAIVSVTTSVSDSHFEGARVHTNGFEGERDETTYSISADVTVKDADGRRPEDGFSATARRFEDLPRPNELGRRSAERALAGRGASKIASGSMTVVVENRAARRLVTALLGPLSGRALQQKQSFLEGQLGKPIASKLLTVTDEPHLPRGLASRLWDGDGIASKRAPVIEAGVLRAYFVDVYYARKLGVAPTTGGASNLVFTLGNKGQDALVAYAKEGLFVTSFLGGNQNGTTGDFSLGVQGRRIVGGRLAEPISEMNLAGNQRDLWQRLVAVGDDPWLYSSLRTPTLVFEKLDVAGR